jgi:hypothetical protein
MAVKTRHKNGRTMLNVCVLWRPFWKWRLVEIFRCQESIWDIITYPHMKCRWNRTMLNLWSIVVAILKMATGRIFQSPQYAHIQHCSISTSWIASRHRTISTGLHFQNGYHYTPKIQHCSISKVAFDFQAWFQLVQGRRFFSNFLLNTFANKSRIF